MNSSTQKAMTQKVQRFLRSENPIAKRLKRLSSGQWHSYLFGGAVREILIKTGNPQIRDLDIVIDDVGFPIFCKAFESHLVGINRFGGRRLMLERVPVDVWALSSTWAFSAGYVTEAKSSRLPKTTFLNTDAVVFEITPGRVRQRLIAAPFIEAMKTNVLDIVLKDNPHPSLAAVRTIRTHIRYNMPMSRGLARFTLDYLEETGVDGCIREQVYHYHRVVVPDDQLKALLHRLRAFMESDRLETSGAKVQMDLL